jgi:hypothetical protein
MSDGGRNRASLGSGSLEVISKVERTSVRRSLHRLVRSLGGCQHLPDIWAAYSGCSDSERKSRIPSPTQIARRNVGSEKREAASLAAHRGEKREKSRSETAMRERDYREWRTKS